jgi:prepilin-type N-terminal cleavage/methylation domain-containing protein
MTAPKWSARRRQCDQGFTLVELLMFILLFGIVSAVITTVSTSGLHRQRELQDRGDALAQARTAVQRVDRDIRSATYLDKGTSSMLLLQEPLYSGTTVTGIRWSCYYTYATGGSTELVGDINLTSASWPCAPSATSQVLLRHVTNSSTSPLFSFSPKSGFSSTSGTVNSGTCAMSGTSPVSYEPSCVGTVTVHALIQPPSLNGAVSVTDNGTELRNVQ